MVLSLNYRCLYKIHITYLETRMWEYLQNQVNQTLGVVLQKIKTMLDM